MTVEAIRWPALMLGMYEDSGSAQWHAIAEAAAILPGAIRFGVLDNGNGWIACAQILPAAGVRLFANDATMKPARGRGAQTATIQERLRAAAFHRFSCVAAEVAPGSISERNYLRCGFHLSYTRTHYARKITSVGWDAAHNQNHFRLVSRVARVHEALLVLAFPGSSCGWFSIPSKAMNKGNGKNLAARPPVHCRTTRSSFAPLAFLTAVLLWSAIRS